MISWVRYALQKGTREIERLENPLLIPGVGAQGGSLEKSMEYGNKDGISLINVSRSIIFSSDLSEKSIRSSAKDYVDKMREIIDE